jgi:hypothetical protein
MTLILHTLEGEYHTPGMVAACPSKYRISTDKATRYHGPEDHNPSIKWLASPVIRTQVRRLF